jgi:hypothetical protein
MSSPANRVVSPANSRETAHFQGEVAVLGYWKYLEVWNRTSFLKSLRRSSITARDDKTLNRMLYNQATAPPCTKPRPHRNFFKRLFDAAFDRREGPHYLRTH